MSYFFYYMILPGCIATLAHSYFVHKIENIGQGFLTFGTYAWILTWIILLIKFVKKEAFTSFEVIFGTAANQLIYGGIQIFFAIVIPVFLSIIVTQIDKEKHNEDKK